MKANYIALSAAAITLTLASCSNDELESLTNAPQNAIGFSAINSHVSRATPITTPNSMEKFNVYAFTSTGNKPFMGTADGDFGTSGGITIKNSAYTTENNTTQARWEYNNSADIHYWTTEALNFYAVSPISAATELDYKWKFTGTSNEIKYTCSDEYKNDAAADNVDVMYAIAKDQLKTPNSGIVGLKFHHILSQVVFSAKTEYTNMKVEINSIKINNLKNSGTFTLPNEGAVGEGSWSQSGTYHPTVTKTPIEISTTTPGATTPETKEITSATNNPLMVIPQKPTAWATSSSNAIAINSDTYLEISCKISQNGVYIFGAEGNDGYGTIYVPFGGDKCDWKPGKRYIYTLIFGGGYKADGSDVLTPINFTAEVESWDDSNTVKEDLPLKP